MPSATWATRRRKTTISALVLVALSNPILSPVFGFSFYPNSLDAASHRQFASRGYSILSTPNTALHLAKNPSKGTGKSTQPEPAFSFAAINRKVAQQNKVTQAPAKKNPPKKQIPKKTSARQNPTDTAKMPTLKIVENLQKSFQQNERAASGAKGRTTSKQEPDTKVDTLPFFAINKENTKESAQNPSERIVETLQKAVQLKSTPEKPTTSNRPPIRPPTISPQLTRSPTGSKEAPGNPIERVQAGLETKQAEVKQKALQAKQNVVGAVETTKATIDTSISKFQQLIDTIAKLPQRIQQSYANAVQFILSIPPQLQNTADKVAAIPEEVRATATKAKDKVTAIPGQIEATKNDIVEKVDRTIDTGKQTIQNVIDFPRYVQQKVADAKTAVDEFIYDVKVLFKQAPPRPKPPKSPPKNPANPIAGAIFWVLKGVAGVTGKVVSASAEAVVSQVKKQNSNNENNTISNKRSASAPARKDGTKTVTDIELEAEDAVKLADEALERLRKLRPGNGNP